MDGGLSPESLADEMAHPLEDVRLKEYHHRVVNSLAMITSIIGLETRALSDPAGRAALERVRSRLVAVSNLYRILHNAGPGPWIDAARYLRSVADAVAASVGSDDRVAIEVAAEAGPLSIAQAAPLGLITNEAMTNAYKHAFGGLQSGRIRIALTREPNVLCLSISDDGCGMPERVRGGVGTTLMASLVTDLNGELTTRSGASGTSVEVRFRKDR